MKCLGKMLLKKKKKRKKNNSVAMYVMTVLE